MKHDNNFTMDVLYISACHAHMHTQTYMYIHIHVKEGAWKIRNARCYLSLVSHESTKKYSGCLSPEQTAKL